MSLWLLLGVVALAGAVGGLISSYLTDNGFVVPQVIDNGNRGRIWYPGFLGNLLTGAVAASVSWLLYGPLSQVQIGTIGPSIALATIGGAVIVGMTGSGWLANAVGKNLFQAAASRAATAIPSPEMAEKLLTASPVDALNIANRMATEPSSPLSERSASQKP